MLTSMWSVVRDSVNLQTVLVGIALFVIVKRLLSKRYHLPPGPFALPLLGNLLSFKGRVIYKLFFEWSKTYGSVFTVYFGPARCVVINSSGMVREALIKKSSDFAGRPNSYTLNFMTDGASNILDADYSPVWKLHRKLAMKALRQYLSGTKLEVKVQEAVTKGTELIMREKGAFNPKRHLSFIVANLLCGVCFDSSYEIGNTEFERFIDILDALPEQVGSGFLEDFLPPLRLFPTKRWQTAVRLGIQMRSIGDEKLQKHREEFDPDNIRDYTDFLLLAQSEETDKEMLSDVHIKQGIADIFAAGIDTSRNTLQWTFLYMAVLLEIQFRVQRELDSVLGGRFPRLSDKDQLPYTEATLHESMRMSPVNPIGVPHKTTRDTMLGTYEIPANTMVIVNTWGLHHDPKNWHQPERFLPDRFLDESGKMAPKPDSWIPFSAGRRNCLGESVAKPELFLIFAALMQKFHVFLEPGVIPNTRPSKEGILNAPPMCNMLFTPRQRGVV